MKRNKTLLNILLLVLIIIIIITIIESVSWCLLKIGSRPTALSPLWNMKDDNYFGYVNIPGVNYTGVKGYSNGTICYNATYHIDEFGRRYTRDEYKGSKQDLLLLGCSVTFGEGLSDNDTLQYYLSSGLKGYNVYDYAVSGYGSEHILALIDSGRIKNETFSSKKTALYMFIPAHVDRTVGDALVPWIYNSPYFTLNNGRLEKRGSFTTGRPFLTFLYNTYAMIRDKSNFLNLINFNPSPSSSQYNMVLTANVIKQARDDFVDKYNGTFILVFHPVWNRSIDKKEYNELRKIFMAMNISILDYSNYEYSNDKVIDCDLHPKGILNKDLAGMIAKDLKKFS
jgi:hypothetical protein